MSKDPLCLAMLTLYPQDTERIAGGVRAVAANLVQGLRHYDDLDIHVVHCHGDIGQDAVTAKGPVTIHYLVPPNRWGLPNMMTSISRIRQFLRRMEPDIVHAHIAQYAKAAQGMSYPWVYTIHGVAQEEAKAYRASWFDRLRYALYTHYDLAAVRRAKHLVAISQYTLAAYRDRTQAQWYRINNPLTDDFFSVSPKKEKAHQLLYVGSITEVKEIETLLKSLDLVRRTVPEVHLQLAGRVSSQDYLAELQWYIQTQDLQQHITFSGLLSRSDLLEAYARCSILVLSSRQENAPMAIIEAMAAGKAVVATEVGGVGELVDEGQTGYLVPVGAADRMAQRIIALLKHPERRQAMGRRARDKARARFSLDSVASQYRTLYRHLADLPAPGLEEIKV
jgi:glycosyltransferase involved in cell wall biosynthesis